MQEKKKKEYLFWTLAEHWLVHLRVAVRFQMCDCKSTASLNAVCTQEPEANWNSGSFTITPLSISIGNFSIVLLVSLHITVGSSLGGMQTHTHAKVWDHWLVCITEHWQVVCLRGVCVYHCVSWGGMEHGMGVRGKGDCWSLDVLLACN